MWHSAIQCKKRLTAIPFFFLNVCLLVQNTNGQEPSFDSTHFYTTIAFDANCEPVVSLSRTSGRIIDKRLFLIEQDSILEELDVNKDQRRQLKAITTWHRETQESISHTRELGKRNDAFAKQETAAKESNKRLQETLLDHQVDLLNNIQQRIYLRRLGVLEYLHRSDIGKQMKLKPYQIKKIESTISELNVAWRRHKKKKSKQLIDRLLEVLDDQQKKDLQTEFGSKLDQTDFDVHSIFLALIAGSKILPSKKKSTEYLDAMTDISQFVVQYDGSWEQQKIFERLSEGSSSFFLMGNLQTEGFFKRLVLPASKVEEMKQLQRSILVENTRLMAVRQREIKSGVDPKQATENQRESMRKDYARAKDWIDENLDEEQFKQITRQFRIRSMRCNGLIYELVGKTGKKLRLTREQRNAIKAIATEENEVFFEDSSQFETRLYSEIHKSLSRNQSKLLAPVTRWRPGNLCPSISLLLLDNRGWPRTRINLATGEDEMGRPVIRSPRPIK